MTFAELQIGDKFRFDSERTMPHSGLATGPWVKISAKRYLPYGGDPKAIHIVGTVKVLVLLEGGEA